MSTEEQKNQQLSKTLHSILVGGDYITEDQFRAAQDRATAKKEHLVTALVNGGYIADHHLGELMAYDKGIPFVDLSHINIPDDVLHILPEPMAQKYDAIVFKENPEEVSVAMHNTERIDVENAIHKKTGKAVKVYYATHKDVRRSMHLYKVDISEKLQELIDESKGKTDLESEESVVVQIVHAVFRYAYDSRASDIHIEPAGEETAIRFRVDGLLRDVGTIPVTLHQQVITRIKVLAKLRTDEHRIAQDGKLMFTHAGEEVDVRVSVVPITDGEKVVMRLLTEGVQTFTIDSIGLADDQLKLVREAARKPHGMLLATGPTGSGKTTSLYSALRLLNSRQVNIATIEDPVEYDVEGVNQIQVNPKTNLTFASGLRAIVRQDPDVIMVGEIRDDETASIAVNSAMTGHLVLSTLHTNDAATTLPRLMDMGIEPFLIASTVNIIVAQRLVRRLAPQCLKSTVVKGEQLAQLRKHFDLSKYVRDGDTADEIRFYEPQVDCSVGDGSGYIGRVGIFEVMIISDAIRELIMQRADADKIREKAIEEGMITMYEDGLRKALQGVTSIHEVMRVIQE